MQAINVGFLITMITASIVDIKTHRSPVWILLLIITLTALKGIVFQNLLYGFILMAFSMYFSEFLLKPESFRRMIRNEEEHPGDGTFGGGDVWIGTLMCGFMGFNKFLIAYTVAALLGMVAMMTVYRKFRWIRVPYVPYLAVGAFIAMVIK